MAATKTPGSTFDVDLFQAKVARWQLGALAVLLGAATVVRPLLVQLDPMLTWLGLANTAIGAGAWYLLGRPRLLPWAPLVCISITLAMLAPCLLLTGGVNSQFAAVLPLMPVFCVLFSGPRLAIAVSLLCGAFIGLDLLWSHLGGTPATSATLARAFWLALATGIGTIFGLHVAHRFRQFHRLLERQALQDTLTGAANRRALEDSLGRDLAKAARTGQPVSVLLLDVDHFKRLNDRLGHAAGDRALQQVVAAMRRCTRSGQDLVARYGGEEFVVLLSDTGSTDARLVAEKIRLAIAGATLDGAAAPAGTLTVTIGCATSTADQPLCADSLLKQADDNLYRGKAGGRNQVVPLVPRAAALQVASPA